MHNVRKIETLRPISGKEVQEEVVEKELLPLTWWEQYTAAIGKLPEDTCRIIEDDARYIVDRAVPAIPSSDEIDVSAYGQDRVLTGMVVGSVQSGKTASMLAVAALALDRGIDVLVILAGTRVALWLQTFERLLKQLDGSDLYSAWSKNSKRVLVPQPEDILSNTDRVDPYRYLRGARLKVKGALVTGKPVIFVVPKEDDHLLALAKFLTEHTDAEVLKGRGRPLRMVVLDDEADDASILDAQEGARITPQFIQYLWSSDATAPATRNEWLLSSYIAYTATPQANYLQRSHNPLAPRNFHAALRVPSDKGEFTPRSDTYCERKGLSAFYCGGEHYYERLRDMPGDPCVHSGFVHIDVESDSTAALAQHAATRWEMIGNALRSYFVGAALRLLLDGKRFSSIPSTPSNLDELLGELPAPHTMLYHPSALREAQFSGAEDIARWCSAFPGREVDVHLPTDPNGYPLLEINAGALEKRLSVEEDLWKKWVVDFSATAAGLASLPGYKEVNFRAISWSDIRGILISDVFPNTKLRVLNSDPRADDRPNFGPVATDASRTHWRAPEDIFTIFVAGNVLSRGLTVEGLSTSLFLRGAREPAADTQMQMQRWFGYRGAHLAFCRVFLYTDQLQLFRQYHYNDLALKKEILNHMDGHSTSIGSSALILQGNSFWATAKIESHRIPLHPGATPAVRIVERSSEAFYETNISLIQSLLSKPGWQPLHHPAGAERGAILSSPITMLEVAEVLEQLRYSAHDPAPDLPLSQRWESLQRMLNLDAPLFRPPGRNPGAMAVEPSGCPYSIAAYLRLWNEALRRHDLPGMQPTDNPTRPWHMLDLNSYRASAPNFYVGIRYGSEAVASQLSNPIAQIKMMRRGLSQSKPYLLDTLWGSRNPTQRWKGDQVFDFHFHSATLNTRILEDGVWRQRGQPGLLLIHPVIEPKTNQVLIAVGLAIPRGGPDHVAALRVSS